MGFKLSLPGTSRRIQFNSDYSDGDGAPPNLFWAGNEVYLHKVPVTDLFVPPLVVSEKAKISSFYIPPLYTLFYIFKCIFLAHSDH